MKSEIESSQCVAHGRGEWVKTAVWIQGFPNNCFLLYLCVHASVHWPSLESWYRSDTYDPRWADSDTGLHRGLIFDVQQTHLEGIKWSVKLFAKFKLCFLSTRNKVESSDRFLSPKVQFLFSPVPRIHRCYTPTPHSHCQDSCGSERHTRTGDRQQYMRDQDFYLHIHTQIIQ